MNILCPTDFSAHSTTAVEYAIHLANALGARVHIVSIFQVNRKSSSFVSLDDIIRKNTEEDMKNFLLRLDKVVKSDLTPITKVIMGSTVDTILNYSDQMNIDLIVMGTQGDSSMRTILFGSTTKKIVQKSNVPILAIPETVAHRLTTNRMVLSLDDKIIESEKLFKVPKTIADTLDLKIDILHITQDKESLPFDPFISSYLGETIGEVHLHEADDPVVGIKEFAEKENVGMLIMIRREKSFWKSLFVKGNTSEEVAKTNIPLLILPE